MMYVVKKDDLYLEWYDGYTTQVSPTKFFSDFKHYSLTSSLKKALLFDSANEAFSLLLGIPGSTVKKLIEGGISDEY